MRRAVQRRVPKHPHKPSSMRLGARRRNDTPTLIARAFGLLDWAPTLHPISWTPVRFLADGTTEDLSPAEAAVAMTSLNKALAEVRAHGTV